MPTYSYTCKNCGYSFDIHQEFTDSTLTECPQCAGRLKKNFGTVGISFKGSGFYHNDSREANSGAHSHGSSHNHEPAAANSGDHTGSHDAGGRDGGSGDSGSKAAGDSGSTGTSGSGSTGTAGASPAGSKSADSSSSRGSSSHAAKTPAAAD